MSFHFYVFSSTFLSDFFDGGQSSGEVAMDTTDSNSQISSETGTSKSASEQPTTEESKPMAEKLPEGFFDDPKKDAKVILVNKNTY